MARRSKAAGTHADARDIAAAIVQNFGGDAALHGAFAAACEQQFPHDVERGDAACAAGDLMQLERLAHDLTSALLMLGHLRASALAADLEARSRARDARAAVLAWQALRSALPEAP